MPMDAEQVHAVNRINLAERFGWTLEYVDSLSYVELNEIMAVITVNEKLDAERFNRK
jgi:hypothetical protein